MEFLIIIQVKMTNKIIKINIKQNKDVKAREVQTKLTKKQKPVQSVKVETVLLIKIVEKQWLFSKHS